MRALCLLNVAAFAVCLRVPAVALARAPTFFDRIRMVLVTDDLCRTRRFRGSLYGVTATVEMDLSTRKAAVELSGLVLGGGLSGTGWLNDPEEVDKGSVVLDDDLAAALAWRGVRIVSASLDRETDSVSIGVTIPVLGFQRIVLSGVS